MRSILVTNDDGIDSVGLWTLVQAVAPHADRVAVVAPKTNQSAVGAGFTLHRELKWERFSDAPVTGVEAWHVDGTPADCVMVALDKLIDWPVDLIASGINQGANVGHDVLASGTVGGALAGHLRGKVAMAFSLATDGSSHRPDWRSAERVASLICAAEAEGKLPASILLNVNIPPRRFEELSGILVTRMGRHGYVRLQELTANSALIERRYDLHTHPDTPPGTDIWAVSHGYVSVSPLQANLTDHLLIDLLGQQLNAAFRT